MKLEVTFKIDARFITTVDAESINEALEKAKLEYYDADFGEASDVDGVAIIVENEDGDIIWEK